MIPTPDTLSLTDLEPAVVWEATSFCVVIACGDLHPSSAMQQAVDRVTQAYRDWLHHEQPLEIQTTATSNLLADGAIYTIMVTYSRIKPDGPEPIE